jgi:carbon storage regulator
MLVLSRKEGERIVIGDNVTLVISKISGNRVTIGIEAPRDVKIVRGELDLDLVDASVQEPSDSGSYDSNTRATRRPVSQTVALKGSLREFAASVLPLHRQVG